LARILSVADCFDALLSDRPYRPALSLDDAVDIMKQQRDKIFDPRILDLFLDALPELMAGRDPDSDPEPEQEISKNLTRVHVKQTWTADASTHTAALRYQSLALLSHTPDQLWAFYEILDMLGADLEYEKGLTECLRILYRPIPFEKAGIFVLENDEFVLLAAQGFPDHCVSRFALSRDHGLIAQAVVSRTSIAGNAPPSELPDGAALRYLADIKSSLVAPLIVEERVVGLIALCAGEPDAFSPEQARALRLITPKLARTLLASRKVQRISVEAETDTVTGLPNGRAAFRRLEIEMNRAQRERTTVGILFMDVDGLKPVNDSFGHRAGDELLVEVAARLKGRLRAYDFAARVGGDEFIAILPGVSREDLVAAADSMRSAVADAPIEVAKDTTTHVTISIGSAMYPYDGLDADDLVAFSDRRMYEAKMKSRNSSRVNQEIAAVS
jgi:diguanylate cyclase (GGDEF)-like protein